MVYKGLQVKRIGEIMKFSYLLVFLVLIAAPVVTLDAVPTDTGDVVVIAMCRPSVGQIKNIEQLYERDLIQLKKIKLLGVYHEDEKTNYLPSYEYVKTNNLTWVGFVKIRGMVGMDKLFGQNRWTPQFRAIFEQAHGIIFTGGADIPPAVYGEGTNLLTYAGTPVRSLYELSFLFHLVGGSQNASFEPFLAGNKQYPVLAICLGAQTLNVAAGGSLIQDIPTEVYGLTTAEQVLQLPQAKIHSGTYAQSLAYFSKDLSPAFHAIKLKKNNLMVRRMGFKTSDRPHILTSHHQAVKKVGKNLVVTATSLDGKIVEMLEHRLFQNVVGVQFHPEVYALYMKGKWYRQKPDQPQNFNLRDYLTQQPPSMIFHQKLWQWFSIAMSRQKGRS